MKMLSNENPMKMLCKRTNENENALHMKSNENAMNEM